MSEASREGLLEEVQRPVGRHREIVNGAPGLIVRYPARSFIAAFTVANGRIVEIDLIADPDKLRGVSMG